MEATGNLFGDDNCLFDELFGEELPQQFYSPLPPSTGNFSIHLPGDEYNWGSGEGDNEANNVGIFNNSFPFGSVHSQGTPCIDPRQLQMATPVADHTLQGVFEDAQDAEGQEGGNLAQVDIPLALPMALPMALPQPQPLPLPQPHPMTLPLTLPTFSNSLPRTSPTVESIVDQALAPNRKGNRVTKNSGKEEGKKAGKKAVKKDGEEKTRTTKAFSCDACRRSKTKCVPVKGSESCELCTKKKCSCHVSGVDGRTNKTNQERLDAAAAAVNDYLTDAVLLCAELSAHDGHRESAQALLRTMSNLREVRLVFSNVTKSPLKEVAFHRGPFRQPVFYGPAKLADVRKNQIPQLKQAALEQGETIASLLSMLAFGNQAQLFVASSLIDNMVDKKASLDTLKVSMQRHFSFPVEGIVHQSMRRGVEKCLNDALN